MRTMDTGSRRSSSTRRTSASPWMTWRSVSTCCVSWLVRFSARDRHGERLRRLRAHRRPRPADDAAGALRPHREGAAHLPGHRCRRRASARVERHVREAVAAAEDTLDDKVCTRLVSRLSYIGGDAEDDRSMTVCELSSAPRPHPLLRRHAAVDLSGGRRGASRRRSCSRRTPRRREAVRDRPRLRPRAERAAHGDLPRADLPDRPLSREGARAGHHVPRANALFEPVWNREHVASIQITMAEDFGRSPRRVLRSGRRDPRRRPEPPPAGARARRDGATVGRRRRDSAAAGRRLPGDAGSGPKGRRARGQYVGYQDIEGVARLDSETFVALALRSRTGAGRVCRSSFVRGRCFAGPRRSRHRLQRVPHLHWGRHRLDYPGHDDIVLPHRTAGGRVDLPAREDSRQGGLAAVSLDLDFAEELGEPPARTSGCSPMRSAATARSSRAGE